MPFITGAPDDQLIQNTSEASTGGIDGLIYDLEKTIFFTRFKKEHDRLTANIGSYAPLEILEVNDGKHSVPLTSPRITRHSFSENNMCWVRISLQGATKADACSIKVRNKQTSSKIWKVKPGMQNTETSAEMNTELPIVGYQTSQSSPGNRNQYRRLSKSCLSVFFECPTFTTRRSSMFS
jgi:hypothetical protein